jgi:hypothetical protein
MNVLQNVLYLLDFEFEDLSVYIFRCAEALGFLLRTKRVDLSGHMSRTVNLSTLIGTEGEALSPVHT